MITTLKYILASFLGSLMLKNKKKILILCILLANGVSSISQNPKTFLKATEKNVKKINQIVANGACSFYSRNSSIFGIKIQAPRPCKRGQK